MEAIKHFVRAPQNHEVRIKIPPDIPENDLVEIILILRKKPNDFEQKINELKTAMNDELFLSDLREVSEEFEKIDCEEWEE
jgi:hypothetical protein